MRCLMIAVLGLMIAFPVMAQRTHVPTALWRQATQPDREPSRNELRLHGNYVIPGLGNFDVYAWGAGGEVQYRRWTTTNFGWALSAGAARWTPARSSAHWGGIRRLPLEGGMTCYPVGGSALWRFFPAEAWALSFDGGLRYVGIHSGLKTRGGEVRDIKVGRHALVAAFGIDVEREVAENLGIYAGIGYWYDLVRARASYNEKPLRDHMLESAPLRLGLRWEF